MLSVVSLSVLLAGCTNSPIPLSSSPSTAASSTFAPLAGSAPAEVTSGLESPWSVVFVDDTPLVSERDTGRILEIAEDGTTREVGTVPGVEHGGEGGLLGLAIDDQERLYAYSTGTGGNRVQRFTVDGEPGAFALGDVITILDGIPSAGYHNGGRLAA